MDASQEDVIEVLRARRAKARNWSTMILAADRECARFGLQSNQPAPAAAYWCSPQTQRGEERPWIPQQSSSDEITLLGSYSALCRHSGRSPAARLPGSRPGIRPEPAGLASISFVPGPVEPIRLASEPKATPMKIIN